VLGVRLRLRHGRGSGRIMGCRGRGGGGGEGEGISNLTARVCRDRVWFGQHLDGRVGGKWRGHLMEWLGG